MPTAKASTRSSSRSSCPKSDGQGRHPRGSEDQIPCPDFNLATTLASGQVFRWNREGDSFSGWIGDSPVEIVQQDSALIFQGSSTSAVERFFSLDVDLKEIARRIDVDENIHAAIQNHWGLRLIRQDPWECLASFILSAYNNIPRLTGILDRLAERFGELSGTPLGVGIRRRARPTQRVGLRSFLRPRSSPAMELAGDTVPARARNGLLTPSPDRGSASLHRFPTAEKLAGMSERVLRNCGLGFRAPYLRAAARAVAQGIVDLERLRTLEDESLREALLTIPGVGEKVAECVMLFAYGRASAFPVDVWIGRAMRAWYFRGRKVTDRRIREFARRHFGPPCGWAQQYLYCLARGNRGYALRRPSLPD
ncbi:MAG: hypothetical protein HY211_04785 [Candidatus Omnitrophica bacterium]|nr:hypothetical protein [Candidatus Omnitrophota bacterium]